MAEAQRDTGRLWLEILILHALGLPLAIALGYWVFVEAGPIMGAMAMVGFSLLVISIGVAHLVRKLMRPS